MKKVLSIILAMSMVFALCACAQQTEQAPSQAGTAGSPTQDIAATPSQAGTAGSPTQDIADATPTETTGEKKHVKMGLAMQSLQAAAFHAWADYLELRLNYEADQRGYEVELITTNADNDVTKQANDIRDLIAANTK